jgi:virginiamycin A acetyltransferase
MSKMEILQYSPSVLKASLFAFYHFVKKTINRERYRKKNIYMWDTTEVSDDSEIGSYTYIGNNSFINKSKIGRYCSIANNVSVGPSEHPSSCVATWLSHINTYDLLYDKECIIGHDVWIGVNSVVRRGVTIGNSAIIGANSFVNMDIPEFAIAAGSPAKIIKYRLSPEIIEMVKSSRWWDYDVEESQKIITDLQNIIQNACSSNLT